MAIVTEPGTKSWSSVGEIVLLTRSHVEDLAPPALLTVLEDQIYSTEQLGG
jgi:hypothetical protein